MRQLIDTLLTAVARLYFQGTHSMRLAPVRSKEATGKR